MASGCGILVCSYKLVGTGVPTFELEYRHRYLYVIHFSISVSVSVMLKISKLVEIGIGKNRFKVNRSIPTLCPKQLL